MWIISGANVRYVTSVRSGLSHSTTHDGLVVSSRPLSTLGTKKGQTLRSHRVLGHSAIQTWNRWYAQDSRPRDALNFHWTLWNWGYLVDHRLETSLCLWLGPLGAHGRLRVLLTGWDEAYIIMLHPQACFVDPFVCPEVL